MRRIYWAIHLSQLLAIAFALLLYVQNRSVGKPFLIVCVALVLQSIGLETFDDVAWWRPIYLATADLPFFGILAAGILLGVFIVSRGWSDGKRKRNA